MKTYRRAFILTTLFVAGLIALIGQAQESVQKATPAPSAPAVTPPPPSAPGPVVIRAQPPSAQPALGPLQNNVVTWDADLKEATVKAGETQAHFTFNMTNVSSGDVTITAVSPGCGCTVAQLSSPLPWKLTPGATAQIPLTMNVAPNTPPVIKTVTVSTDKGAKTLMIKATGTPVPTVPPAPAPTGTGK